jgi:pyruvate formate lyase activating enzyme
VCPRISKSREIDTLADQATPAAIARAAAELDCHSVAFSNNDLPRVCDGRGG